MEMNAINNVRLYESVYNKTERSTPAESKKASKSNKDTVALSDTAKFYKATMSALSKVPDIREEKVARIKAMMESGNYNVSDAQLADKILGN